MMRGDSPDPVALNVRRGKRMTVSGQEILEI